MSGPDDPNPIEDLRPAGMAPAETVLWEAMSRAAVAAYSRLLSMSADTMSPAALDLMAYFDAEQAAQPYVDRVAHSPRMREALKGAFGREGVFSARSLITAPMQSDVTGQPS